jgi:hypothetical protein
MKKRILLLTAAMALFAFNTFAQRNIDWSVEAINIPPSEMKTRSDKSATDMVVEFVAQNNGTDTAQIGDTVYFRYSLVLNSTNTIFIPGPGSDIYLTYVLTKELAPSDTIILKRSLSLNLITNYTFEFDLRVSSLLINRRDSNDIVMETGAGLNNNSKLEKMIWYDAGGHGVSVRNVGVENNMFTVYPNPSDGFITVSTLINAGIDEKNILNIFDVNGRIVFTKEMSSLFTDEKIDISHLNNGIYFVELNNGHTKSVSKLQISK